MIWNYARFKICIFGFINMIIAASLLLQVIAVKESSFAYINSLMILGIWASLGYFMVMYGLEPMFPDIKWGKDAS